MSLKGSLLGPASQVRQPAGAEATATLRVLAVKTADGNLAAGRLLKTGAFGGAQMSLRACDGLMFYTVNIFFF